MEYSIEVENLTRRFGKFIAVDAISFKVKKGEVFGFLGANGAGKSTTIRMLCAILKSTSGTAKVAGYDINREPEKVKRHIGYMSQRFSLYDDLTVIENLRFFGGIYGIEGNRLEQRIEWALNMADLGGKEEMITRSLPVGWKQRLSLGCAALHEPDIIFLDEPTGGVDPLARRIFWDIIDGFAQAGSTVFVTTHYLDEAEYCHNINLIQAGKIIAGGSPGTMKEKYIPYPMYEISLDDPFQAMNVLEKAPFTQEISLFGTDLHLSVKEDEDDLVQMITLYLQERGLRVNFIDKVTPSLEDVFLHLVEN